VGQAGAHFGNDFASQNSFECFGQAFVLLEALGILGNDFASQNSLRSFDRGWENPFAALRKQ
jgi:hypothetical protein